MRRLGLAPSRSRLAVVAAVTLVVVSVAAPAFACGGMVSNSRYAELTGMSALLSFDGSTERLLVQVGFGGTDGESFAWLMPFPAAPDISKASTESLETAIAVTTPPERDEAVPELFPSVCACGAGGEDLANGGVEHLGTQTVGGIRFDTITGGGDAVNAYLDEHDFRLEPHQRESIEDYMRRGWVMVTGTVERGAPAEGRLTPVSFAFPTDEAVYPLQIAGDDHAGTVEMDVVTVTPFRPRSTTYREHVVRPSDDGTMPPAGDRLELVYAAPLSPELGAELRDIAPPEGAWLGRYRATWNIPTLDQDLVLAAGPADHVDFEGLLASYEDDARWVPLGRFAWTMGILAFVTLVVLTTLALVTGLVRLIFRGSP